MTLEELRVLSDLAETVDRCGAVLRTSALIRPPSDLTIANCLTACAEQLHRCRRGAEHHRPVPTRDVPFMLITTESNDVWHQ
jgi:hypothetical protein